MQMLSALDATFIYLESEHSPMAIGAVYVIDAKDAPRGFGYQKWRTLVASRLQYSKVFRERLIEVPWDLSFPYWIRDPDFDLDAHLPNLKLPEPGGMTELMQAAAKEFGQLLDRAKPLWEISFVEGLDTIPGISKGSFALVTKVHHAAVDGKASSEMMTALLDVSPKMKKLDDVDTWEPEELPSNANVIARSWLNVGQKAVDLAGFVGKVAVGAASMRGDTRLKKLQPPPRILSAPSSKFNQPLSAGRTFWGKNFDFSRLKAIRKAVPDCTINDVVLAICSGGLRSYLAGSNELPEKPLVAMAPISVRGDDQGAGNKVSAMLVNLATDMDDALERLRFIHSNTQSSKIQASALPVDKITEFLPSETLAAAARVYTRTRLGGIHRPFFNVTITNVPGPPVPIYVAGARVHSAFGMAPIMDGLGLILVVLSYDGRISIGISSCEEICPDPQHLAMCFEQSLQELESAIDQADTEAQEAGQETVRIAKNNELKQASDPLKAFHDATEALDKAIKSLEE
jgi:WS/DGAT/MGAT family acyltransferase